MRIQLMSDLHAEFHRDHGLAFAESLDPSGVDVLVLAGDIGVISKDSLEQMLSFLCAKYPHVVYVAGNHEFYNASPSLVEKHRVLLTGKFPNLYWLENSDVIIQGRRFLGGTLWFPRPKNPTLKLNMNDFHVIREFEPWVYEQHAKTVDYLRSEVKAGDIVVTHMLPTSRAVSPRWRGDALNPFFAVDDIPDDVLGRPAAWFFGHTHDSVNFRFGDCTFMCNPFGYARVGENTRFQDRYIIHLDAVLACKTCEDTFVVDMDAPWMPALACPHCGSDYVQ